MEERTAGRVTSAQLNALILQQDVMDGEFLDRVKLVRRGSDRRSLKLTAWDVLGWMEGLGHGEKPATVCPALMRLAEGWNQTMDGDALEDILKPMLADLPGTNLGLDGAYRWHPAARRVVLHDMLPGWLRLAGFRDHAREMERADWASLEAEDLTGTIMEEIDTEPRDEARQAAAHHATLQTGAKLLYWEPWEGFTAACEIITECAYRAIGGLQEPRMKDLIFRSARDLAEALRPEILKAKEAECRN